jgi:DNA-binding winged helix-turn-helix (wHTH) protein
MAEPSPAVRRQYRFGPFLLSPSRRILARGAEELPLIPRYFDLLQLLVMRRHEAVHRREIFDVVWSDVIVSDSALTQAVRILRRTLGDDPREPRYIRTVSRHGYRFVFPDLVEELDDGTAPPAVARGSDSLPTAAPAPDAALAALERLTGPTSDDEEDETARREAAELLHQTGTAAALARLGSRPGHEQARAYLRDARWDVPGAGPVPLLGTPGAARTLAILFNLRLRRARRLAGQRWLTATAGGALAGLLTGGAGGVALWLLPGSRMTSAGPVVLGLLGMAAGGLGAAGVGAGLAIAETLVRSWRRASLTLFGAAGGGGIGASAHLVGQWTVQGLFGRDLSPTGGGFEGLVIGGAVGLGYALATPRSEGGMATPRGAHRFKVALLTGLAAACAAAALAATGSHLGAMSVDFMAKSFPGSQVSFDPLARLLGESIPGSWTRIVLSAGEGLAFGFGLAAGLTRRPR